MKKVFALMMVSAFAVAIVACGGKTETAETADTTTVVVEPAPVDTVAADTTVVADTTAL